VYKMVLPILYGAKRRELNQKGRKF
jgi:hypothetical protein